MQAWVRNTNEDDRRAESTMELRMQPRLSHEIEGDSTPTPTKQTRPWRGLLGASGQRPADAARINGKPRLFSSPVIFTLGFPLLVSSRASYTRAPPKTVWGITIQTMERSAAQTQLEHVTI